MTTREDRGYCRRTGAAGRAAFSLAVSGLFVVTACGGGYGATAVPSQPPKPVTAAVLQETAVPTTPVPTATATQILTATATAESTATSARPTTVPATEVSPTAPPAAQPLLAGAAVGCVNFNTAGFDDLRRIINVDDDIANQIISLRAKTPFTGWDDLVDRVKGIGENNVKEIQAQGLGCF